MSVIWYPSGESEIYTGTIPKGYVVARSLPEPTNKHVRHIYLKPALSVRIFALFKRVFGRGE